MPSRLGEISDKQFRPVGLNHRDTLVKISAVNLVRVAADEGRVVIVANASA